jgi:hypothetical protein
VSVIEALRAVLCADAYPMLGNEDRAPAARLLDEAVRRARSAQRDGTDTAAEEALARVLAAPPGSVEFAAALDAARAIVERSRQ